MTYVPYYIDKALADGKMVGLPITLANFSDATMETAHKQNKRKSLLFSGGRAGPISTSQYQEQVIRQQPAERTSHKDRLQGKLKKSGKQILLRKKVE